MAVVGRSLPIRNIRNWSKYLNNSVKGASYRRLHMLVVRERGKLAIGEGTEQGYERARTIEKGIKRVEKQRDSRLANGLSMFEAGLISKIIADTALKNRQLKETISAKEYSNLNRATIKLVKATAIKPCVSETLAEEAEKEITRICGAKIGNKIRQEIISMQRIILDWVFEQK